MTELSRTADDEGRQHLARLQCFTVAVLQQKITLQLAGKRACSEANRFAFKHLLDQSGKPGVSAEEKAARRLMHRTFPAGNVPGTEAHAWHGQKAARTGVLSHDQKYGKELVPHVNPDKVRQQGIERYDVSNTVIDLSSITLAEVLEKIATAFWKADIKAPPGNNPANARSAVVKLTFGAQCILKTHMYFNATAQTWGINHYRLNEVFLVGARPYANAFEIYHLGQEIPG